MNNDQKNMEWIDKYLDDRLTAGELETFNKMQQEDSAFRELVHDMKLLVGGIRCSARDSLQEEIRGWESKQPDITGPPQRSLGRRVLRMGWISLAAAACLTALLYLGIFRPTPSERMANTLYRSYFDGVCKNVDVLTYRSDKNNITLHQEAFAAYDLEDYQRAAAIFSGFRQKSDTVLFYLGNSWLAVKEYEKAAECFHKTLETGKFRVDETRWFLALSLLKSGKVDEAGSLMLILSEYPNYYQAKALEIISKLSTFH